MGIAGITLLGWMTLPMRRSSTLFSNSQQLRDWTIRSSRGTQEPAWRVSCRGRRGWGRLATISEVWGESGNKV